MGFFKYLGLVLGLFFVGSSNYILYLIWNGMLDGGILYGLSMYFLAGVTYLIGISILGIIYFAGSGFRDISTGITFLAAGFIHFTVLILTGINNPEVLLLWAPQTGLSILMGSLALYLGVRKLRRRLVEIAVPAYI